MSEHTPQSVEDRAELEAAFNDPNPNSRFFELLPITPSVEDRARAYLYSLNKVGLALHFDLPKIMADFLKSERPRIEAEAVAEFVKAVEDVCSEEGLLADNWRIAMAYNFKERYGRELS